MKFYSESLKRLFDTEDALREAESKAQAEAEARKEAEQKKSAERKARAAEVETAREAMVEAGKKYYELLTAFCNDYGTYHYSVKSDDMPDNFDLSFIPFARLFNLI